MLSKTPSRVAFQLCFLALLSYCQLSKCQESCHVLTRLPTSNVGLKDKESCASSCEQWTGLETCQVDPTCFFKTTLSLVEPAAYGHLLDMANLNSPSDIERRMNLVKVLAQNAMNEINDVFESIAKIHFNFEEAAGVRLVPPGPSPLQPDQNLNVSIESNLICPNKCEFRDKNTCKLSVFCYFNEEITELQLKNSSLSHLLNLSNLDSEIHKFDDEGVLEELFRKLRIERIQLKTFLSYAFNTYNIMVDMNNRNIEYITNRLQSSEFSEAENGVEHCSNVYRPLLHRPSKLECVDDFLGFLVVRTQGFGSGVSGFGGGAVLGFAPESDTGVVSPRANCPGICVNVDTNGDCVKDIPCLKRRFNFS